MDTMYMRTRTPLPLSVCSWLAHTVACVDHAQPATPTTDNLASPTLVVLMIVYIDSSRCILTCRVLRLRIRRLRLDGRGGNCNTGAAGGRHTGTARQGATESHSRGSVLK